MAVQIIDLLTGWFESKPLVMVTFPDGYGSAVNASRHGLNRFTHVEKHGWLKEIKPPTLCLIEMPEGSSSSFYVGVVKSKAAVATFDSRVTFTTLKPLNITSFSGLPDSLDDKQMQTLLRGKLSNRGFAAVLSPRLSESIVSSLSRDPLNKKSIESAAYQIPRLRKATIPEWEQFNAIKTAMTAFGLNSSDRARTLEISEGSDSTLNFLDVDDSPLNAQEAASVLEDNVIGADASVIPGFELEKKLVTGKAVFTNDDERLVVYTANRGPLEKMLGVDLIYINETVGSSIMVQYKMLSFEVDPSSAKSDWVFRPDKQFDDELERMKLPPLSEDTEGYRMHDSPFFLKFVRRKGDGETHASFILSLAHLKSYLESPKSKGLRGGVRVSFDGLEGVYLREADLLGMIRSGYAGTYRNQTKALIPIIKAVSEGNRALVLAWQKRVQHAEKPVS
jgi:hypothetical protein